MVGWSSRCGVGVGVVFALLLTSSLLHGEPGACPDQPLAAHPCVGHWRGWGENGGVRWSIDMVVDEVDGRACGTIDYPSLGCGGLLESCRTEGEAVYFDERYTRNPGTCAAAGRIEAVCRGDRMVWTWDGIARATTTLERVK